MNILFHSDSRTKMQLLTVFFCVVACFLVVSVTPYPLNNDLSSNNGTVVSGSYSTDASTSAPQATDAATTTAAQATDAATPPAPQATDADTPSVAQATDADTTPADQATDADTPSATEATPEAESESEENSTEES